jgi:BirA family biotin operon repressor/biotin-[acetyl-CoA-carboxylase] ligase
VPGSDTRYRLLRHLADGAFHSGQQLADSMGISRTAVWKQLQALRDTTGLQFDAVKGKGYRLGTPVELFQETSIRRELPRHRAAAVTTIHIHDTIDSTNTWLMGRAAAGAEAPAACLAERQTAGKGRQGRAWVSPYGTNVYLSVHWRFNLAPAQLGGLSLACGAAVAQALEGLGVKGLALKWPNDLLWQRRKLAGLLLEVRGESSGPSDVIAGIGVNTRMPPAAADGIDQPWADLAGILGDHAPGRNRLAALLIDALAGGMETFAVEGLGAFVDHWNAYDHFRGEQVTLRIGERVVRGDYLGVEDSGAIRLRVDGVTRSFQAGEVNLTRATG